MKPKGNNLPLQWWKVGGKPSWVSVYDLQYFRDIYFCLEISPLLNNAIQIRDLIASGLAIEHEPLLTNKAYVSNLNLSLAEARRERVKNAG